MTADMTTDHSKAVLEGEGISSGAGASRADRPTSFRSADFAVPSGHEEEWRFTPVKRIAPFLARGLTADRIEVRAESGSCEEVDRGDGRVGTVGRPEDLTGALAWEATERAHVVTLRGRADDAMLAVDVPEGMHVAHIVVLAEEDSRGTVVLEHGGGGDLTETVEIDVGDQRIRVGRDAKLRHIVVTVGGDVVRVTTSAEFSGEGGDLELLGAYITESDEHHEHRLFIDHDPANCRSRATYKGALQGRDAHAVWIGDVLIRQDATQTDTYELNRNLVLTKGAYADSVPNLEIETGEIAGAGHASATGRFDEEQLFYLRARGIPEDVARRLVVRGFFAELIDSIGVASVQDKLMAAIERELDLAEDSQREFG